MLLNVRSGVQHLADKLDFVDGKVDPDSVPDSPVPASDHPDDIIKQISHILSRSGNLFVYCTIFYLLSSGRHGILMTDNSGLRINNLMNSLGEDGLEGAKARAGNDLSRNLSSFRQPTTRVGQLHSLSGGYL